MDAAMRTIDDIMNFRLTMWIGYEKYESNFALLFRVVGYRHPQWICRMPRTFHEEEGGSGVAK